MLWWIRQQLKSSKWEARVEAARKLGASNEKKAAPALVECLPDENHEVRRAVIEALGAIAHPAAAEPLSAALAALPARARDRKTNIDKSAELVEYEALAAALGAVGTAAVRPLLKLLSSEDAEPRRWAACALGFIKDPQAIEPLAARLDDARSEVRKAAAHALGDIGDPRALKPLINALANKDPETRRAAAEALGAIKAEGAVRPLASATGDPTEAVQLAAVDALRRIGGLQAAVALRSAFEVGKRSVREASGAALKSMPFAPANAEERATVAVLFGDFPAAVREGTAAVQALAEALASRDAARRRQAADALASLRSGEALAPLLRALKDHDPQVQNSAARALANIGFPAVQGLVDALGSPDASVQREAARALGEIRDPRSVPALVETITRNRSTTEEYPDSLEAARAAADSLQSILFSGITQQVAEGDLLRIAGVPDCMMLRLSNEKPSAELALDCTRIRDLARQELERRSTLKQR
jgi:HEAT repeat protein